MNPNGPEERRINILITGRLQQEDVQVLDTRMIEVTY